MSNFSFLKDEFNVLYNESYKSESNVLDDPEVSAIYARKALENSIKFIYNIDEDLDEKLLKTPNVNIFDLIKILDDEGILPEEFVKELHFIRKLGNNAVHGKYNSVVSDKESLYANKCLYKFQRWIVEVYSSYEIVGDYDVTLLAHTDKEDKQEVVKILDEQKKLEEQNAKLLAELEKLKALQQTQTKEEKKTKRSKVKSVDGINEAETRKMLIDVELSEVGIDTDKFKYRKDIEFQLTLEDGSTGYADYVIWDADDTPLAVIEAKKYSKSVEAGKYQAKLYAQALQRDYNKSILIFVTNGKNIEYTNGIYPFRPIHSFFPKSEIKRVLQQKQAIENNKPSTYEINQSITDRGYQHRVIKSVLTEFENYHMRTLLVMATGTGKTRVSASLSDVLVRSDWVRRVLFLADRVELVKQAKNNFSEYLDETCTNLLDERDLDSRMHFGTYETVHNLIRKGEYNSSFFDLIIVDEAHRTIYRKYRAIFEYFDSFIVGLTATPVNEIHRSTYEFFQTGDEEPTDAYPLDKAVADEYLVPFKAKEIDLGLVKKGIKYKDLTPDEQEEYEEKFEEEEGEEIANSRINNDIFNQQTNEKVLKYLHKHGHHIEDGNKLGKTIIFAKNTKHAEYIKKIFDKLYPHRTNEAEIIHHGIAKHDILIDNFKNPNKDPQIAISVDMLDTGIDVPEILNLVFFKDVKSKTKFWQMIGRGTRLCPNIFGVGADKKDFYIFDFGMNFTYFGETPDGIPSSKQIPLKERLFLKRVNLIKELEDGDLKTSLIEIVKNQIDNIDTSEYSVKKDRFTVEKLQGTDLNYLTDEIYNDIKTISIHIEDLTPTPMQSFSMEILNSQGLLIKGSNNQKYCDKLINRCKILKSKSSTINAIKENIEIVDKVLTNGYNLSNINDLETIRVKLESIADLSIDNSRPDPITTNFNDKVVDERDVDTCSYIDMGSVKTEFQKVIDEYINNLEQLKAMKESSLVTASDIDTIKQYLFSSEEILEDKLKENNFENVMKDIINSSNKEVANKVLDNFIGANNHTQKQIEIMIRIKNIVFGKTYLNIKTSIINVTEILYGDNHPLADKFDKLSEEEQDELIGAIKLLEKVDGEDF